MDIRELLTRETRTNIEGWCRRNAQSVYLGDTVLCRVLGKYLMHVDPKDRSLAPHLMLDGYWEIWITMAIAKYIKPGMNCIDVGANVGYYSVLLADWVGSDGRVLAFEPEEKNFRLLEINLEKLNNALPYKIAASDRKGETKLFTYENLTGDHSLEQTPEDARRFSRESTIVRMPLDDVGRASMDNQSVHFIKIDVEGHERAVWRGMRELLATSQEVQVAVEWTRQHDVEAELVSMAEADGFLTHDIHSDGTLKQVTIEQVREGPNWRMLWFKR